MLAMLSALQGMMNSVHTHRGAHPAVAQQLWRHVAHRAWQQQQQQQQRNDREAARAA
jgi:hypothetical protein